MARVLIAFVLALMSTLASANDINNPEDLSPDAVLVSDCLASFETATEARNACETAIARDCLNEPAGTTTAGMVACSARAETAWEELRQLALSVLADDALGRDEGERDAGQADRANHAANLFSAEQAWEIWRERECVKRSLDAGTGLRAEMVAAACQLSLTRERVLDHWYR